jgi:hypothetical protein
MISSETLKKNRQTVVSIKRIVTTSSPTFHLRRRLILMASRALTFSHGTTSSGLLIWSWRRRPINSASPGTSSTESAIRFGLARRRFRISVKTLSAVLPRPGCFKASSARRSSSAACSGVSESSNFARGSAGVLLRIFPGFISLIYRVGSAPSPGFDRELSATGNPACNADFQTCCITDFPPSFHFCHPGGMSENSPAFSTLGSRSKRIKSRRDGRMPRVAYAAHSRIQPSLRDLSDGLASPSVETLGYSRFVPAGQRRDGVSAALRSSKFLLTLDLEVRATVAASRCHLHSSFFILHSAFA